MRKTPTASVAILSLAFASLAGCAHVKGVVIQEGSDIPMRTAVFTLGRPNGIGVLDRHTVKTDGSFDFYILPTDADQLFLFDGAADPELSMRHIAESEFNDHMRLTLGRAPRNSGALDVPVNIP